MAEKKHEWKYVSVGGVVRVKIESGEDIACLGELDQKKWTVLSCPVKGLEFDEKTLALADADKDGKIRVSDIVTSAQWITSVLKDKNSLLKGDDTLPLEGIDTSCEEGLKLYNSAKQILANLGQEKDNISIADTSDSVAIFGKTRFNGDGVITAASSEDEAVSKLISDCIASVGSVTDRSGEQGVNTELVEKFYTALADYAAWQAAAEEDSAAILPYGENTAAANAAVEKLSAKISDYFIRCKLINFDDAVSGAVDVSVDKVSAISDRDLSSCMDEIAAYPLCRPSAEGKLPFGTVNPAWQADFASLKSLVFDVDYPGKDSITEAEWAAVVAKFAPFAAWKAAEKGSEVAALGLDTVKSYLAEGRKDALLSLIAEDSALKEEADSIDAVDKLLHFYRDFYRLLNNYVIFSDFYSPEQKAMFEVGKLYIDERCCNLCIKVEDMGKHADMAALSNLFLIYCKCTSAKLGKSMDIAAVMTAGNTRDLRPGKNAIFYDREGNDWDAVVTKVVDNPISVRQAFWAPYRKFWNFCVEKINKSASDKDSKLVADMQTTVNNAEVPDEKTAKKQAFDIAKFAGIFAAIGMAVGFIADALVGLAKGVAALHWWQLLLAIAAIILIISGPACFIAWGKLRKRNLGPVLNANGWAINSRVLINILFGSTLTNVAKYPVAKGRDPFGVPAWKKWIRGIIVALILAFAVLLAVPNNPVHDHFIHKKAVEQVEEAAAPAVEEAAPAAEVAPAAE